MSSPREAVYDVLLSKAARARRQVAREARTAWEKYEAGNRVAHGTYMAQRSDGKANGRAKP